ncbi:MAG TPA: response regulator [Anaeromyxobacter sp.]|nr:response regulator [Anaeromyxobacter sp.]
MKRLLVVEDDAAIREMMRRRLAMRGFDVRVAGEGPAAIAAVHEHRPEALLLDIELPGGMNGWEVIRVLRDDPRTAGIQVFVLTAHVTPADVDRAARMGCPRFFGKPVDFRSLVEALGGEPARAVAG